MKVPNHAAGRPCPRFVAKEVPAEEMNAPIQLHDPVDLCRVDDARSRNPDEEDAADDAPREDHYSLSISAAASSGNSNSWWPVSAYPRPMPAVGRDTTFV